jgi:hypothetical protein
MRGHDGAPRPQRIVRRLVADVRHASGTSVQYPALLFSIPEGPEESGVGQRFMTRDGRARLSIFTRSSQRQSPGYYLNTHFPGSRSRLDYDRVARNFFAVSTEEQGQVLYRRCNFPGDGMIHCIDLTYPAIEKRAWDQIVTRISRSLRPL